MLKISILDKKLLLNLFRTFVLNTGGPVVFVWGLNQFFIMTQLPPKSAKNWPEESKTGFRVTYNSNMTKRMRKQHVATFFRHNLKTCWIFNFIFATNALQRRSSKVEIDDAEQQQQQQQGQRQKSDSKVDSITLLLSSQKQTCCTQLFGNVKNSQIKF